MNVTLRIPDELGSSAKLVAIDEGKSLNSLITELIEEKVKEVDRNNYRDAAARTWKLINEGGMPGISKGFSREEIYNRGQR